MEMIAKLGNEIEAQVLSEALEERGVPHVIKSYHDAGFNGLFQFTMGWGHVEAPEEARKEVEEILESIRNQPDSEENSESTE
jgi:hypothetical protein